MAIQNHTYLEEKVTKNVFETAIKSKIDAKNLFTTRTTLQGVEGDVIVKNTYKFTGAVVDADTGLAVDAGKRGKLTVTSEEKRIKAYKAVYDIFDKEKRQNADVVPFSAKGQAEVVWNFINDDVYTALRTIKNAHEYTAFNWDAVEDALAELNLESRDGMFLLVSPKMYSQLKKSEEVKSAQNGEIIFTGQVKMVDGLAIVVSNKMGDEEAIIASKDTVVHEIKMDANVSIDVYNELEKETFVTKLAGLVFVENEEKAIKLTKAGVRAKKAA